jgi:NAD(P)-dependent dehydrogenase (short-subunit alcohol dehydrogenase family)
MLTGKSIIITGVGPGMGRKLALEAVRVNARVTLAARSKDFLESVAREITEAGAAAIAVVADVSKQEDCNRIAQAAIQGFGRIDGLVNSAYGSGPFVPFEDGDLNDWRKAVDVTLFGSLQMIKAVLPQMKANGGGSIVNVSTMETRKPQSGHGVYAVAKSALNGVTRQLAVELGKYRIRVNTAVMGWMWGAPVEAYIAHMATTAGAPAEQIVGSISANIPLGHIPPDQECAKTILTLLSDFTSQVTGTAIEVNGGEWVSL